MASTNNNLHAAFGLEHCGALDHTKQKRQTERWTRRKR